MSFTWMFGVTNGILDEVFEVNALACLLYVGVVEISVVYSGRVMVIYVNVLVGVHAPTRLLDVGFVGS